MAQLDVSSVLTDPMISDRIVVTRRKQTVNNHGRGSVLLPETLTGRGVVCAAGPNDLERLPAEQRIGNVISVVTRLRLRGPSKDGSGQYQPDLLTWKGGQYVVRWIDDYSHYGRGFIQALAQDVAVVGLPPA